MYNRILLAVDGSENSLRATNEAIKIGSYQNNCKIEVIHVVDFADSKNEVLHSYHEEEIELKRRRKLESVEELFQKSNAEYKLKILHGEAGPLIVEYANTEKFDLVVIGSRGLNTLQEMVLGSVSHKVIKRAECPVLVVK